MRKVRITVTHARAKLLQPKTVHVKAYRVPEHYRRAASPVRLFICLHQDDSVSIAKGSSKAEVLQRGLGCEEVIPFSAEMLANFIDKQVVLRDKR